MTHRLFQSDVVGATIERPRFQFSKDGPICWHCKTRIRRKDGFRFLAAPGWLGGVIVHLRCFRGRP